MKKTYWLIYRGRENHIDYDPFTKAKPFTNEEAAIEWCERNRYDFVDVVSNNKNKYFKIEDSSDMISEMVKEIVKEEIRKWAIGI